MAVIGGFRSDLSITICRFVFQIRVSTKTVVTLFRKDYWAFCDFEFSRSQLISIHEKIGAKEKVHIIEFRIIEVQL